MMYEDDDIAGSFWRNRTWCDCIQDLKNCTKTLNFGAVMGLLSELGAYGNRMEAALDDQKDLNRAARKLSERKKELRALGRQIQDAKEELKLLVPETPKSEKSDNI